MAVAESWNNGTNNNPGFSALGNPQTSARTITINSGATLSFASQYQNVFGSGSSLPLVTLVINAGGLVNSTVGGNSALGPVTLNGGTLSTYTGGGGPQWECYELGGTVTVGGASGPSTINAGSGAGSYDGLNLGTGASSFVAGSQITFNVGATAQAAPAAIRT